MRAADFKCENCGQIYLDLIVSDLLKEQYCEKCDNILTRLFTRIVYKQKHKDHEYPTHNLGSGEKARFGRKPGFD